MNRNTYIFDMDGLLIDSEPYWQQVETEVFAMVGIELTLEMCQETVGLRLHDVVNHWFNKHPWDGLDRKHVHDLILEKLIALYQKSTPVKAGAIELVESLSKIPDVKIGVCSSSPLALIRAALSGVGLTSFVDVLHSAESDEYGKPHPLPYLRCAQKLQSDPSGCVVFEDSINGAIAGKAAGMYVVAIPEQLKPEIKFSFCDEVISSLREYKGREFLV